MGSTVRLYLVAGFARSNMEPREWRQALYDACHDHTQESGKQLYRESAERATTTENMILRNSFESSPVRNLRLVTIHSLNGGSQSCNRMGSHEHENCRWTSFEEAARIFGDGSYAAQLKQYVLPLAVQCHFPFHDTSKPSQS